MTDFCLDLDYIIILDFSFSYFNKMIIFYPQYIASKKTQKKLKIIFREISSEK